MATLTSVQKAIRVLKAIEQHHESGMRLVDLCTALALEKPTALRLVTQLVHEQLVARHPRNKRYYLGAYCRQLGETLQAHSSLSARYSPLLKRISARSEDASFLVVVQDLDTLCIAREAGTYPIQALAIPVGNRQPIGVGAGGLAMLADLDNDTTEHYLRANRARFLKYKSLKLDELRMRIEKARKKGYAVIGSHAVSRVVGVGVTLKNREEEIVGGISVASLDNRMTQKRQELVARIIKEEIAVFLDKEDVKKA
ncbi:IclR family transcriptional regulator C-terminal domain-containing protein [Pusillimonas sp. SM2304]|uniref:IclR family transcriptional regulator n=1 Tax=Pusillimonas sp. SM2304 TaxID=3073241 RepID=UPI0028758ECC|nr:IclR family transcriptional regulator C-terminal domain-containing protein [Pusillimonas sp. SM2304]MDS1140084.1 IclR family transcriptional regulator C-terminal domain-containing protein [Pusillimonas sp. SM2304]